MLFLYAGTGPSPMTIGSTPAEAHDMILAIGCSPSSLALSNVETIIAAAPSLSVEEFPAVTVPFLFEMLVLTL